MGREINMEGGNRLNLHDAVAQSRADYRALVAIFRECERLAEVGGSGVALDAVVEIASEAGYKGHCGSSR